jgi:hypothetical protein
MNAKNLAVLQRASKQTTTAKTAAQAKANNLQVKIDAWIKLRGARGPQQLNTLDAKVSAQKQELDKARAAEKKATKRCGEVQRTLGLACAVADALKPAPEDAKRPRAAKELSVDAMIDEECEQITDDFATATRAHANAQDE